MIAGERKLENGHLDVSLQKGSLTVPKLKFVSKGGLAVDLEGAAADVPDKTSGSLRGVIEAPSAEAMATLSDLVDLPPDIDAKLAGLQKPRGWGLFLIRAMVDGMDVTTEGTTQTVTLTLIREERA